MTNAIITVSNVHGYIDENGTAWLNAEDVARGLGFVDVHQKKDFATSGEKYETVRWARVNGYLQEFGYSKEVGKEDFIPENMFYRLAMKAKNETAENFQAKVADEILPAIRKNGAYMTPEKISELFNNPDAIIKLCQEWKMALIEKQELRNIVDMQAVTIAELTPKASYYDTILQSKEAVPISVIAKDYGLSARHLNQLLNAMAIQYRLKSGVWLVYQNYAKEGYTCTKTFTLEDGTSKTHTYWTQKGRLFLYETLKRQGMIPLIEQKRYEE